MADIRKPGPKFPPTRLLQADYEDIVPNDSHNERVTKGLNNLVQSRLSEPFASQCTPLPKSVAKCGYKRAALKAALTQQICELEQSIRLQEELIQKSLPNVRTLITAARDEPSLTAVTLNCCSLATPTLCRVRRCGSVKCCKCSQRTLPFTRFCIDHVHLSKGQSLYRQCTATEQLTKLRCGNPVSDILSVSSTCHKHYKPVVDSGGVVKYAMPLKKGADRGIGRGALSGPRSKTVKGPPRRTALPNILKPHKEPVPEPPIAEQPPPVQPKNSLDDLLTLGPPLQSLDLPPLEADLGDIMMAGEESEEDN